MCCLVDQVYDQLKTSLLSRSKVSHPYLSPSQPHRSSLHSPHLSAPSDAVVTNHTVPPLDSLGPAEKVTDDKRQMMRQQRKTWKGQTRENTEQNKSKHSKSNKSYVSVLKSQLQQVITNYSFYFKVLCRSVHKVLFCQFSLMP